MIELQPKFVNSTSFQIHKFTQSKNINDYIYGERVPNAMQLKIKKHNFIALLRQFILSNHIYDYDIEKRKIEINQLYLFLYENRHLY